MTFEMRAKINSLESLSQVVTLAFQSQVWRSMSKARLAGHRTAASRMVPAAPARSHLPQQRIRLIRTIKIIKTTFNKQLYCIKLALG
jgi:hypothetical protein